MSFAATLVTLHPDVLAVEPNSASLVQSKYLDHDSTTNQLSHQLRGMGPALPEGTPPTPGVTPWATLRPVIHDATKLPYKKTYSIWTSEDDQEVLEIVIFQGESERAQENEYLGTLIVPDLPPGTKGNVVFDIIFSISAESILTVTAEERGTARTVTATFSTQDTPDAVRRRLRGGRGEENPRLDEEDERRRLSWMKRLFG